MNKEIKAGDLVKRTGYVLYADGRKFKVSKKTWLVSKVEDGEVFYKGEDGQDTKLNVPKDEGEIIVVGNKKDGILPEYLPKIEITAGSVEEHYRALKAVKEMNWKKGDVVKIIGKVDESLLTEGVLEKVSLEEKHDHVTVVVDPIKLKTKSNEIIGL